MFRPLAYALALGAIAASLPAQAADLSICDTSIRGEALRFAYDPEVPGLKDSLSLREKLYGHAGAITCPGLVTLRALTPDLTDAERGPFCLQWDGKARTYLGADLGPRDGWLTCRTARRSFCQKVNKSRDAAAVWGRTAADLAVQAGSETVLHAAGVVSVKGPAAVIGEKLVGLGATALAGSGGTVVLGAAVVTAVAVGGAVYVCSDTGAEAAALESAPQPRLLPGEVAPGADLPVGEPVITVTPLP